MLALNQLPMKPQIPITTHRGQTPLALWTLHRTPPPKSTSQQTSFELSKIEKLRLGLPGKRDDILQGKFDDKILILLSLFKGLWNVRLASTESAVTKVKEELSPLHLRVFKVGRPGIEVI